MCRSLTGPPSGPSLQHSGRQDVGVVTQGARQPLMGPVEVQSQGRTKQKHRGSVAALGPGACASPHVPAGQGLLQPSPSVPAAVECPLRTPSCHFSGKGGGLIFPVSLNVIAFTGFGNQFYGLRYLSSEIWEALEEK